MKRMNLALIVIFLAGCAKAPSEDTIETIYTGGSTHRKTYGYTATRNTYTISNTPTGSHYGASAH